MTVTCNSYFASLSDHLELTFCFDGDLDVSALVVGVNRAADKGSRNESGSATPELSGSMNPLERGSFTFDGSFFAVFSVPLPTFVVSTVCLTCTNESCGMRTTKSDNKQTTINCNPVIA